MNAGNCSNQTRLVTMMDYLSPKINSWLAELDYATLNSYDNLLKVLRDEYGDKVIGDGDKLRRVIDTRQNTDETVAAYASRLAAVIEECEVHLPIPTLVGCFVDGLDMSIQEKVRDKVDCQRHSLAEVLFIAKKKETSYKKTQANVSRLSIATPVNPKNCIDCKTSLATQGKDRCRACFNIFKNKGNPSVVQPAAVCTSCGVNPTTSSRPLCSNCYKSKGGKRGNNNYSPTPQIITTPVKTITTNPLPSISAGKADFTVNKVKVNIDNDNSMNKLDWSQNKLYTEKRCYFCTELTAGHSLPLCKDKYEHYYSAEIKTLIKAGVTPPIRKVRPTGPPVNP